MAIAWEILYYKGAFEPVKEGGGEWPDMQISNFKLEAGEFNKIKQILGSLQRKTQVDAVFLINRNGQEITHHGQADSIDVLALSSLAASNLAATFGLASIIGETEFERIYLRGRRHSILISPAGEYALLLFVIRIENERAVNIRNLRQAVLVLSDVLNKCTKRFNVVDEV